MQIPLKTEKVIKMKSDFRICFGVCAIVLLGTFANAQNTVGDRNAGGVDATTSPGGTVQEITKDNSKVTGSRYLNEDWTKGSIELTGGNSIKNVLLRYDVENGIIELYKSEKDVKVINETFVKSVRFVSNVSVKDNLLLNGKQFYLNYVPLTGLVLTEQMDGKYNLITRFEVKKSESYYVQALDAGKEQSIVSIDKMVYLGIDENIEEIPTNKKKILALFSRDVDSKHLKSYVNDNDLNLKKYSDLVFLVNYVNKQVK